jgi:glutathione S-transferase
MAKLKIYGIPFSRAFRVLWMAEELGIEYEHIPTDFVSDCKKPDYLAINPNGKIPAIDDDGVIVWESMACNLYLAKKAGGPLAPSSLAEEAHATQWSFWVMTLIEPKVLEALLYGTGMMDHPKDASKAKAAIQEIAPAIKVLDDHLAKRSHLLGDAFTVADLNVAAVFSWAVLGNVDLSPWPKVKGWLEGCLSRPAALKFLSP